MDKCSPNYLKLFRISSKTKMNVTINVSNYSNTYINIKKKFKSYKLYFVSSIAVQ